MATLDHKTWLTLIIVNFCLYIGFKGFVGFLLISRKLSVLSESCRSNNLLLVSEVGEQSLKSVASNRKPDPDRLSVSPRPSIANNGTNHQNMVPVFERDTESHNNTPGTSTVHEYEEGEFRDSVIPDSENPADGKGIIHKLRDTCSQGQHKLKLGSRKFPNLEELIKAFVEMKQPLPIHGNMRIRTPVNRLPWELDDCQVQVKPGATPVLRKSDTAGSANTLKKAAFPLDPSISPSPPLRKTGNSSSQGSDLSMIPPRQHSFIDAMIQGDVTVKGQRPRIFPFKLPILKKQDSASSGMTRAEGSGNFFEIAGLVSLDNRLRSVTLKTTPNTSPQAQALLFQEGWIQLRYKHPNIVQLLGITVKRPENTPLKLVLEQTEGTLHCFLTKRKLSMEHKVKALFDIAAAMEYLMTGYVCILHRDIAARNCYVIVNVDTSVTVKLGNFEKAKEAVEGVYRQLDYKRDQLTERWTAPEVFDNGIWTCKTEVWSYGVLMWETFWDGYQPYGNAPFAIVLPQLKKGRKLDPTWDQPEKMAYLMGSCLRVDTTGRPDFTRIRKAIYDFARDNGIEF